MVVRRPSLVNKLRRTLGPRDAGRMLSEREYLRCQDAPGYVTEIIDGVVQVSPSPRPTHQTWMFDVAVHLRELARRRPEVINYVTIDSDVVVSDRPGPTRPRPDVSAYRGFPDFKEMAEHDDWAAYSPVLVVEIISKRRARKDTARNRALYWQVPSVLEYWVIDPRKNIAGPRLIVHAREAGEPDWVEYDLAFGETWESKNLPGLRVNLKELR